MKNIASFSTAISLLVLTADAFATPPTKDECVEAHSRGQDARDKGQLTDAKRMFLLCAQSSCPALVQSDCAKFGDELSRTVPSVTFVARDGRGADLLDTEVFVDGAVAAARLDEGKAHDIDPGKHSIRFVHAGKEVVQTVVISAGEKGRQVAAVFDEGGGSVGAVPPPSTAVSSSPNRSAEPSRSAVPLVVAGVGGAALVVGVVLLATGLSGVPDNCSRSSNECAAPPGDPSFDDAHSAVNRANIGLGVGIGGAAVAAAGLIWYFASSPSSERSSASLAPWTDGRGGGASWRLRF